MAEHFKLVTGPGANPELGDVVYGADNAELGVVGFFYDAQGPSSFAIQIHDTSAEPKVIEDRVVVEVQAVLGEAGNLVGRRLVKSDRAYVPNGGGVGSARLSIANQV